MVGLANLLSSGVNGQLLAMRQTARSAAYSQKALVTGNSVNSSIDDPRSFFASSSLKKQSNDLNLLLDQINQSTRTIQMAQNALNSADAQVIRAREFVSEATTSINSNRGDISEAILANDPVLYYRFNEEGAATQVTNHGTAGTALVGRRDGGALANAGELSYATDSTSVYLDGVCLLYTSDAADD